MLRMQPLDWPSAVHHHRSEVGRSGDGNLRVDEILRFFSQRLRNVLGNQPQRMIPAVRVGMIDDDDSGREAFASRMTESQLIQVNRRNRPTTLNSSAIRSVRVSTNAIIPLIQRYLPTGGQWVNGQVLAQQSRGGQGAFAD